ncbi:Protein TANC2 [Talaromyces islandicus]|uniref:Protein TANC2 n=1 Tax=Talaromyces islandicus TaxID=28573 RepID=A0A0U1M9J6_TALIS|nr:Protein TANC2 [Talaromyces islandicus]
MSLVNLPAELILEIADYLDKEKDMFALLQCSRRLHDILIQYLYVRNAASGGSALAWCAAHGFERNVERLLQLKVDLDTLYITKTEEFTVRSCEFLRLGRRVTIDMSLLRACMPPLYLAVERVAASQGNYDPTYVGQKAPMWFVLRPGTHERIVEVLFKHGADPNFLGTDDITPLTLAVRFPSLEIVSLLLNYGATTDYPGDQSERNASWTPPIHELIELYDLPWPGDSHLSRTEALLENLVSHGADINSPNNKGKSLLHLASALDDKGSAVRQLIRHGADVNCQTPVGFAALHACTGAAGHVLLENGARLDITNRVGDTPLHTTTWSEKLQRIFLDAGADPNCKDPNGESVLLRAANMADPAVVKQLIERGADVNTKNIRKETRLHRAAQGACWFNVKLLLDHGADVNAELDMGETALDLVTEQEWMARDKPCANCIKAKVECRVVPPQAPRRRAKRPQELYLIQRLKKYEAYMSQHGLDPQSIADSEDDMEVMGLENELGELKASLEENAPAAAPHREDKRKLSKWFAYYKEYRITHDMLHDLIEDEYDRPTMHHAFDVMFENNDSFPFSVGGAQAPLADSHPSAIQIFQLWQIYINNVNPLLKIIHVPTLQARIVEAGADTANVPKSFEALIFAIYFISVHSMPDEEAEKTLGDNKKGLLAKYHQATQQALINAGFMKSNEIVVLQAYLLYLFTVSQYVDPRTLFCLIGMAVRIAIRLGLHKDGGMFGLTPFESELRKRLWWQIVTLDQRIAGITGTTITALSSIEAECRVPLNVNDTSLYPHAKKPPAPELGATEMTFCLTRIDFALASNSNDRKMPPMTTAKSAGTPLSSASKTNIPSPIQGSPKNIESYCAHIEHVYLRHCDPNIAVQFFALMTSRISLCNLHIADFLRRGVPSTSLDDQERKKLFIMAVQMLEYDNIIYTTDSVRHFLWYTTLHVPVLGYAFLVNELHHRKTGELCERAWKAICTNHENRGLVQKHKSPMHVAFSVKLIKAWDAHYEAERQLGKVVQPPPLLTMLRERYSHLVPQRADHISTTDPADSNFSARDPAAGDQAAGSIYDGSNTMFTQALGGMDMAFESEYEQMDWSQLVQFGAFESFGGDAGSMFTGGFHSY